MNLNDPASVEEVEDGGEEVCKLAVVIHNSTTYFYKKFCQNLNKKSCDEVCFTLSCKK